MKKININILKKYKSYLDWLELVFLKNNISNIMSIEKISKEIEEKGMQLEMAKYMEKYIGKEFEAYITEIYQHGMLAKTENMIVGKIKLEDILDDKYYFDYDKNAIIGKKTKRKGKVNIEYEQEYENAPMKKTTTVDFQDNKVNI